MEMTRRSVLALMATAGMDPERLLWVPGRKTISIAAPMDVVPIETLFGMPEMFPFDVPMNERVRAMLAIDPAARFMAEGSGTVRFIEHRDGPAGIVRRSARFHRSYYGLGSSYDNGSRIVIPGRDTTAPGAYGL